MRRARVLPGLVVLFLTGKLAVLSVNLFWFPVLRAPRVVAEDDGSALDVALLVPMRNEAHRLAGTVAGFLAATRGPVIFLDDESTDGSGDLVRGLTEGQSRVSVLAGRPRPPGWAGKTWALDQLAEATSVELLVFCDADVHLRPGALATVVEEMDRQHADAFSVFCRQLTRTWSERLLMPLIEDVVLCFLPHRLLTAPVRAAATAHGALWVFRRSTYDALGGFGAVRGEVVEDVAMAKHVRRQEFRLGLALGGDVARIRMYSGWTEIIHGMARGLVPAAGGRRALVLLGWLWHVAAYSVPILRAPRSALWAVALVLGIGERVAVEAKTGRRDWAAAWSVGLSPLAAAPVVARAMRRQHVWKDRVYG